MKSTARRPSRGRTTGGTGATVDGSAAAAADGSAAVPPVDPRRTREEHAHELAQDYVEIIADLIATTGEARASDLARRLRVTHVTVGRTVRRMQRAGLVTAQPYRSIFLTDAGRELAEASRRRHVVVLDFLRSLGVPEAVARSDAEGIEHHVSRETLDAFCRHLGRPC